MTYLATIPVRVAGIPALAGIVGYTAGRPAILTGHPDHRAPADPEEIEFEILDRRGRPAPWLERKLAAADRQRIEDQLVKR